MAHARSVSNLFAQSARLFYANTTQSLAILAAGLLPGALLAAAAFAATGLTSFEAVQEAINAGQWARALPLMAAALIKRLLGSLVFIALVLSADARLEDRPLSLSQSFGQAVGSFWPFVITGLLAFLYIFAGFILFIIPGLVLAARYSFAHLAVLLEHKQAAQALARSRELVGAQAWHALSRLSLGIAAAIVLNIAVALLAGIFFSGPAAMSPRPLDALQGQLQAYISELLSGLAGAWLVSYSILLYRDLREATTAEVRF